MQDEDHSTGDESRPADAGSAAGVGRGIVLVLAASLLFKLAILFQAGEFTPVGDENQYLAAGRSVALGEGIRYRNPKWDPLRQGPLYPLFLGLVFRSGGDVLASKVLQVLLSTATVGLVFSLARRWLDRRSALAAATLLAFYPNLIAFTHYNYSETFYLFWIVLACWTLFGRDGALGSPRRLFVAGIVFGLAALARPVFAYLVPCLLPWIHWVTRDVRLSALRAGGLSLGFGLVILPITVRIHREHGGFLLISSMSAEVWYECYNDFPVRNHDYGSYSDKGVEGATRRPPSTAQNPVLRSREEMRAALGFLREHPLACVERFGVRVGYLLNPTSVLVRHIRMQQYLRAPGDDRFERSHAPLPGAIQEGIVWAAVLSYLALSVLALIGLFSMPAGAPRSFTVLFVLFFVVLSGLTFAMSRYRLAFVPLLAVAAGHAVAHFPECARRLRNPLRGGLWAIVLAGLVFVWSLHIQKIWIRP